MPLLGYGQTDTFLSAKSESSPHFTEGEAEVVSLRFQCQSVVVGLGCHQHHSQASRGGGNLEAGSIRFRVP